MPNPLPQRTWVIVTVITLGLAVRLFYQGSHFPPYYGLEESELLRNLGFLYDTAAYHGSWLKALWLTSGEYNKGFIYLLAPFYAWTGPSAELIWMGTGAGTCLIATLWIWLYWRSRPDKAKLVSWLWVITLTVFIVCIRRTKWHPLAHLGVASVLLTLAPYWLKELRAEATRRMHLVGAALYGLSVFLYFGNLQYLPPAIGLWIFFAPREGLRQRLRVAGLALVVGAAVNVYVWHSNPIWNFDVYQSLSRFGRLAHGEEWRALWESAKSFAANFYTLPSLFVSLVGLVAFGQEAKQGDRFAQSVLVLGGWSLGLQAWMWGFDFPDCLNWSVVPLCLLLVAGCDRLLGGLRSVHPFFGYAGSVVIAVLALWEFRLYPAKHARIPSQDSAVAWHPPAQLAQLVNTDLGLAVPEGTTLFLPDTTVPPGEGGFSPEHVLLTRGARQRFERAVRFPDRAELARLLAALPPGLTGWVVLSAPNEQSFDEVLLGQSARRVEFGQTVYGYGYPVRLYTFPSSPHPTLATAP